jgi:putative heme-binding domain-containing protein
MPAIKSDDAFEHAMGVWHLQPMREIAFRSGMPRLHLAFLEAERQRGEKPPDTFLRRALGDDAPDVRLYAVRWIADERIVALRDDLAKLLDGPQPSSQYYLAVLAALDWLDHEPAMRGKEIADELLVKELKNESRSVDARTLALRLLSPNNKFLSLDRLRGYLKSDHAALRLEAVRTLAQQSKPKRLALLAELAADESQNTELRADAVAGLAEAAEATRDLLEKLAAGGQAQLAQEATRVLRLAGLKPVPAESKPPAEDLKAWNRLLSEAGDPAAGRRLFFSSVGARCGICHQHEGRGGRIGPDLTNIARSNNREQIVASILQPSREIAPHYQPWSLVTTDGKTHVGLRKAQGGDNGIETYIDTAGNEFQLPSDTIDERSVAEKSIMPDGLQGVVTIADLRDLITFLTSNE